MMLRLYDDLELGIQKPCPNLESGDMQTPDSTKKVAMFLGIKAKDKEITSFRPFTDVIGTTFLVDGSKNIKVMTVATKEMKDVPFTFTYFVTAKHVLLDAVELAEQPESGDFDVYVILNDNNGDITWIKTKYSDWVGHPTQSDSVDALVCSKILTNPRDFDIKAISLAKFCTDDDLIAKKEDSKNINDVANIGITNDVVVIGLFNKFKGRAKIHTILRTGRIAMIPDEQVPSEIGGKAIEMDAYLVELLSIGGLSGSPVMLHDRRIRAYNADNGALAIDDKIESKFLGLIHGHWDEKKILSDSSPDPTLDRYYKDSLNTGMAIVVPAKKIREIFKQEAIVKAQNLIIETVFENQKPTLDSIRVE